MLTGDESCGCLTLNGHLDPTCGCYEEGMAQGKKQLEMELEAWSPGTHPPGCDCLPCRLSRSWAEGRSAQGVVNIEQAQRNLGRILQHPSGILQHPSESDKQNLRRNLSVLLRMNIINFVETPGSRQPTYVLSTQQGDITIGPTSSLTIQKKCMDRILETTGVVVPVVSRVVWRQCIQGLMLICEKVPVGSTWASAKHEPRRACGCCRRSSSPTAGRRGPAQAQRHDTIRVDRLGRSQAIRHRPTEASIEAEVAAIMPELAPAPTPTAPQVVIQNVEHLHIHVGPEAIEGLSHLMANS